MKLSICIPTFNRKNKLINCVNSIYLASLNSKLDFEVCISDNGSSYDIYDLIKQFENKLKLKINKNESNIGYMPNLLKVISISRGDFVWAMGDDDLLMPQALKRVDELLESNPDVDFFFVNSFHLDYKYICLRLYDVLPCNLLLLLYGTILAYNIQVFYSIRHVYLKMQLHITKNLHRQFSSHLYKENREISIQQFLF